MKNFFIVAFMLIICISSIPIFLFVFNLGVTVATSDTVGLVVNPERELFKTLEVGKYPTETGLEVINITQQTIDEKVCSDGTYNIGTKKEPICKKEPTGCPYGDSLETEVCLKFEVSNGKVY